MSSNNKSKDNKNENPPYILSLEEFMKIPVEQMDICVKKFNSNIFVKTTYEVSITFDGDILNTLDLLKEYLVHKRYTEFQGFYDSLTYRYQNINFPTFPSKFQIVNVKESRRKFFDSLLKTVIKLAVGHKEIRKELLKLLYEFIFRQGSEVKHNNHARKTSTLSSESNIIMENMSMDNADIASSFSYKFTEDSLQKYNSEKKTINQSFLNENAIIADLFQMDRQNEEHTPKSNKYFIIY
jgi:hypothetical protein